MVNKCLLCPRESSKSNYLFQKTFFYQVCSKDTKLQAY